MSYKDSGVDIEKGDALVEKIKNKVRGTYGPRVRAGVGGFACLYEISPGKLLAAGTDGVGTKLKIAQHLGIHDTIGIDLVAMCVNDILCTGAKTLFFMDYMATGSLDVGVGEQIISGVIEGCKQSAAALIGGETAEMPGMYQNGEYDLAGFAVGEVMEEDLVDGTKISVGDVLIGLPSTGVHSNGFSLVRKLIKNDETDLLKKALTPTKIYCQVVEKLMENHGEAIKGMAHITGGGMTNISRMNKNFDYTLEALPKMDEIPEIFSVLKERSGLGDKELYTTFNMGVGLVIATSSPNELIDTLKGLGEKYYVLGKVQTGSGKVHLANVTL
ncbi:MAG: phosphoribosylformylglycinamidine cyclo-ligase [Deltaproteobacteria bacterium]|nr:MAG: phosphoribosylformylglycinamidine cyclo-ligase [Deltaproteobacteria bacterium]